MNRKQMVRKKKRLSWANIAMRTARCITASYAPLSTDARASLAYHVSPGGLKVVTNVGVAIIPISIGLLVRVEDILRIKGVFDLTE